MELQERPQGYVGPNLDPTGLRFRTRRFGEGVYAFIASPPPRDNSGCIIGEDAALVIDAGINGETARKIQQMAQRITSKPIRYLVNTNYHGDHTFGNYAFPAETKIVASQLTRDSMTDLNAEKRIRSGNLHGNEQAIADVAEWRLPDVVFDDYLKIDLGGRTVELWHFGPGNTPGDTVVYEPSTQTVWTGNMIGNEHVLPMLLEGGPAPYLGTLGRFERTLTVRRIVPGHGPLGTPQSFANLKAYLWKLLQDVDRAVQLGLDEDGTVAALDLDERFRISKLNPMSALNPLLENLHALNVYATYKELTKSRSTAKAVHA